jgi:hypothetical protein
MVMRLQMPKPAEIVEELVPDALEVAATNEHQRPGRDQVVSATDGSPCQLDQVTDGHRDNSSQSCRHGAS